MGEGRGALSYGARAKLYALDVVEGRIAAALPTRLACQRHLDDLERWAKSGPYEFSDDAAHRACDFVERMPHIRGRWARGGGKIKLADWQVFIVASVFGWLERGTQIRRFRSAYIEVPRKNGKSTLSVPIGLYMLTMDGEPGADVYSAATSRDQARIVFEMAREMSKREHGFRRSFGVHVGAHNIHVENTASRFEPLSSDAHTLEGLNPHCAIIDELHAHRTRDVYDVLELASGSREQPLMWMITTAGSNRAGICYEVRSHILKVLQGVIDDETRERYFGIIYTIDDEDDWTDPAVWAKANPNLGISVSEEDLQRIGRKAQEMPSAINAFLTKRLNVWVSADSAWLDIRAWDRCANREMTLAEMEGRRCFIGLDLASKVDIAAMVALFPPSSESERWRLFGRYYLPEERIEASGNSQYSGWEREGRLIATPGNIIDFGMIEDDLEAWCKRFDVAEVAYDPFQATQFAVRMMEQGLPLIEVGATVRNYSDPMKELEALIYSEQIEHDGDPALTWMMSNVVCHRDVKDNIYPRKEREADKIDGVVATITALSRALISKGPQASVYESRGFLVA